MFGPGSASDTICRIIADKLSSALGQPVIVEDRPGADGALAALYVHHQPADGYTLLMGTNSPLSADPFIHLGLGYVYVVRAFRTVGFGNLRECLAHLV